MELLTFLMGKKYLSFVSTFISLACRGFRPAITFPFPLLTVLFLLPADLACIAILRPCLRVPPCSQDM